MKQTPIKIPKPFRPDQFAIPLVKDVDERAAMKDFGQYIKLMERWGFQRLASSRSLDHSRLSRTSHRSPESERLEDYELWQHPAGVLAKFNSYSQAAYVRHDGIFEPARCTLSSIWLDARIDTGTGIETIHRSLVEIRGTGTSTPMLDGRSIRSISVTVHSNTGTSLYGFMDMIQRHGRLLPFDRWDEDMDRSSIYIDPEIFAPVLEWPVDTPFVIEDMPGKLMAFIDRLPEKIAPVFRKQALIDAERAARKADRDPSPRQGPSWDPVEFGIDEFSEAMFLAGKRWPKPADRALLTHWSEVALGRWGEDIEPTSMRAYEQGPAGLSLPVALLYAKRTAHAAPILLEKLLRTAPLEVLRRWAIQPDGAGYTLGLRMVDRSFTERVLENHAPLDVDVLGILHERLGPEGLVMATPTRSVMGIALQARPDDDAREVNVRHQQHAELSQIIARLDGWGVDWSTHLRWRNYPNLYQDKDKPAFFRIDGPVDPMQWKELMGANYTPELEQVAARIDRSRMNATTPIADVSTRPHSPRL